MKDLIRTPIITSGLITNPIGSMIGAGNGGGGGDPLAIIDVIADASGPIEQRGGTIELAPNASFTGTPAFAVSTDVPSGDYTHSFQLDSRNAIAFDIIPAVAAALELTGDFTIEFWAKWDSGNTAAFQRFFNERDDNNEYIRIQSYTGSIATPRVSNGTSFNGQNMGNSDVWNHICFERQGSNMRQYRGGTSVAFGSWSAATFTLANSAFTDRMAVGYNYGSGGNADNTGVPCLMVGLRIYNFAKYEGTNFTPV
ncbi:LamG-like jellyroll fold domain-containing protein [Halobacteriovorax sp. XZX-3]|uniref:LamG-like jellyroll fold domain-containing protein n=1 Tax=unclassified Halobacteriovorax TaxID=2639665 RepID=UPI003717B055